MPFKRWTSVVLGATVGGLIGPGMGLLLLEAQVLRPSSLREVLTLIFITLKGWIYAFIAVGPTAIVLGAVYGVLLHILWPKLRSMKTTVIVSSFLGMFLGSAVVVIGSSIPYFFYPPAFRPKQEILGMVPLGALTGVLCALLVVLLLRRIRNHGSSMLLTKQQSQV